MKEFSVNLEGENFVFQTGKLAQMADGACLATYRDEVILATVGMATSVREGMDFFPLMCEFQPKYYASGKVKGSRFNKREGRPSDSAVLNSRLIDRPLRPMFPKGMVNDVQVITTVLQTEATRSAGTMAITAASMAILLSGIPFEAPVAAVRVGMKEDGTFFLDPTYEEAENGLLDLVVAGSADAIMMVEAGASQISDEKMVAALEYAHGHIKTLCKAQAEFAAQHEITPLKPIFAAKDEKAEEAVNKFVTDAMLDEIRGVGKKALHAKVHEAEDKLLAHYKEEIENGELTKGGLLDFFNKAWSKRMRKNILEKDIRADGRKSDDVRALSSEVGILPRVHGTGLFQRGNTQVLSAVTIGGPGDGQIIDDPDRGEFTQMYIHHYNFPPFSVGDVKPLRGTNRREIGHGALAERALRYVMPTKEEGFPYFVRVVSEVLACNGSSSMGSACGSTLALMDAGVPIKAPVSGVAMGLVTDESGNYKILADIQAAEDFCGDMDLKVCGTEKGITALQMDIKLKGLKMDLLVEALGKARIARNTILKS
ncbi:polyribonucleotide nucleotidyltransferase, partial [Candidatus Gracilibacteria bacterium]|nr:polyribonucleotide nucleotidyltransferase [Candidatus Gracilibacteria bacterium]